MPNNGMKDKRVLVTGATAGIGEVAALELARQGAKVVIVGRNPQKTAAVTKLIQLQSGNPAVEFLVADLSLNPRCAAWRPNSNSVTIDWMCR